MVQKLLHKNTIGHEGEGISNQHRTDKTGRMLVKICDNFCAQDILFCLQFEVKFIRRNEGHLDPRKEGGENHRCDDPDDLGII